MQNEARCGKARIRAFRIILFTCFAGGLLGADGPSEAQLRSSYLKLPIGFEANQGQADASVRFLARSGRSTLLLTSTEAVVMLDRSLVRMKILGGSQSSALTGAEPQSGKSNYFLGNDSKRWVRDVPRYGRVEYQGVYPGISLAFYGNGKELEYDWVIAPGADPNQIRTRYEGVEHLRLDQNGDLVLSTKDGDLRHRKPVLYQEISGKRIPVNGVFTLKGREVGFQVARYDRRQPLTIDPILAYAGYLGGSNLDQGYGIAVDSSGSTYVTGDTNSANFPTLGTQVSPFATGHTCATSIYSSSNGGVQFYEPCSYIFVSKFKPDGSGLLYSTYIGGTSGNESVGIAVDGNGNAYLTGNTFSSDFPTSTSYPAIPFGSGDPILVELNSTGNSLLISTVFGGTGASAAGLALVPAGTYAGVYITGNTTKSDFNPIHSITPFTTPVNNGSNGFILKYRLDGSSILYSTLVCSDCTSRSIDVDKNTGIAYIAGRSWPNGILQVNNTQPGYAGGPDDAFALALDPTGTSLIYSTYLGGSSIDEAKIIRVDPSTHYAYVGGISFNPISTSTNKEFPFPPGVPSNRRQCIPIPPQNVVDYRCNGKGDGFVVKLSPSGSLLATTLIGGTHMKSETSAGTMATIYVASQTGMSLSWFDEASPNFTAAPLPDVVGGQPLGLATDIVGNVYAAVFSPGTAGNTIQEYTARGVPVGTFATLPPGVTGPFGLAFDASGNLYVSSLGNNVIEKFDNAGNFVGTLANIPTPRGLAIYPSGVLYVVSSAGAGAVYALSDLNSLNQTPTAIASFNGSLADPRFIAFDFNGNLYISNTGTGGSTGYLQKYVYTQSGGVFTWTFGTKYSGLQGPNGIGFDSFGNLFVAEYSANRVHWFDSNGVDKGSVPGISPLAPAGLVVVNTPGYQVPYETKVFGVTFDSKGYVFASGYTVCTDLPQVASIQSQNAGGEDVFIFKFKPDLSSPVFSTYFGGTGDDWTTAMTTDANGGIYVTGYTTQPPVANSGFPTTQTFFKNPQTNQGGYNGGLYDAFVIKLANADIAGMSNGAPKQLSAPTVAFAASTETGHLKSHAGTGSGYSASWSPTFTNNNSSASSGYGADNFSASMPCPPNAVSCTCTSSSSYSCSVQGNVLTAKAPTLAAGSSITIPVQVQFDNTVQYGTSVPLSMTGTSDTNDPDLSNNTATTTYSPWPLVNITTAGTNGAASLQLTIDGSPITVPFQGYLDPSTLHTFCAMPTPFTGQSYSFSSWTDTYDFMTYQTSCLNVSLPGVSPVTYTATFTVTPTCTPTFAPSSQTVGAVAGSGSTILNIGGGCAWTVTSDSWWLNLPGPAGGGGQSSIPFTYFANVQTAARTGNITVNGTSFSLTEAGSVLPKNTRAATLFYQSFLIREPDAGGLAYWSSQPLQQLGAAFYISDEFKAVQLNLVQLYRALLAREPNFTTEYLPGVKAMRIGANTPAGLASQLLAPLGITSTQQLLVGMCTNVNPGASQSVLVACYNASSSLLSLSPAAAALQFIQSPSYHQGSQSAQRDAVFLMYAVTLNRPPDPGGFNYWVNQAVVYNWDPLTLVTAFVISPEFQNRLN